MLELATGVRTPLGGDFRFAPLGNEWATWSPDGKWIAAVLTGMPGADSVVVISAKSPALARRLGRAEGAPVWSPDSRFLLTEKSQLSCALTLYGVSLQMIDVATGKRSLIVSSRCKVAVGTFFWVNSNVVQ
jgi:hypothetical protein